MNTNYFLTLSARKVVLLLVIIPMIIQLVLVNVVQKVSDERLYYFLFFIFWVLCLPYFYWLSTAVGFLFKKANKNFIVSFYKFKISLIINVIVVFNFVFFAAYLFSFALKEKDPDLSIIGFMAFIQFIGVISFAYNAYYICKLIATIDLNRKIYFNDLAGNFILFSFPLASVWLIQGKINKMLMNV